MAPFIVAAPRRHGGPAGSTSNSRRESSSSTGTPRSMISELSRRQNCPAKLDKHCTLWVHDDAFSKEDIVLNLRNFQHEDIKPDASLAIVPLTEDFEACDRKLSLEWSHDQPRERASSSARTSNDGFQQYVFKAKDMDEKTRLRNSQLEVSVSRGVAKAFGFKHRSSVRLVAASAEVDAASHVEISFKDEYLSRADMWQLIVAGLCDKSVYKGQKVNFLDTIKATISSVYVAGKKVSTALFNSSTKAIFRSESARFVLFIQMSREMWDFDSEGSGEIMFAKVVNGFLPALFRRWQALKARHLVTIVLFTRVEYEIGTTSDLNSASIREADLFTGFQIGPSRKPYTDLYRVVVSELSSGEWVPILRQLKTEFRYFRRDIYMHRTRGWKSSSTPTADSDTTGMMWETVIDAEPSLAAHGNILEAINLASSQFSQDHVDRDLVRTGISIVVISAGTGIFEVDYSTLKTTTEHLVASGIGIDLVCLPKIPLHSVPLFRYQNPRFVDHENELRQMAMESGSTPHPTHAFPSSYASASSISPAKASPELRKIRSDIKKKKPPPDEWNFAIPHWLDVSFWTGASQDLSSHPGARLSKKQRARKTIQQDLTLAVRCKMYELEMDAGISGAVDISIPPLQHGIKLPYTFHRMSNKSVDGIEIIERKGESESTRKHSSQPGNGGSARKRQILDVLTRYDSAKCHHNAPGKVPPSEHPNRARNVSKESLYNSSIPRTGLNASPASVTELQANIEQVASVPTPHITVKTGEQLETRKRSIDSTKSSTLPGSMRSPTLSRHISFGKFGVGLTTSKAMMVAAKIDDVTAYVGVNNATTGRSSSMMTNVLLSPREERNSIRTTASSESQATSLKSPVMKPVNATSLLTPEQPKSNPITIRQNRETRARGESGSKAPLEALSEMLDFDTRGYGLNVAKTNRQHDDKKVAVAKLVSGMSEPQPETLSSSVALSPWLNVLKPSNPKGPVDATANQYKRWQHVFPRPSRIDDMKWKSLCSPASIPLTTEFCPTRKQLTDEYERSSYTLEKDYSGECNERQETREDLMRDLVGSRLSQGFQVVVGQAVAEAFGQTEVRVINPFEQSTLQDGATLFLSLGNMIHQLSCTNEIQIAVDLYARKIGVDDDQPTTPYKPAIRTTLGLHYDPRNILLHERSVDYNWNASDHYMANQEVLEQFPEQLKYWRARFVLIPSHDDKPQQYFRREDTDEEIRLEGIKMLTQMWQRFRQRDSGDRDKTFHPQTFAQRNLRNPNPLDIIYRTQDPSVVVNAELETLPTDESGDYYIRRGKMLGNAEPFHRAKLDIAKLAEAIQAPPEKGGCKIINRRWHFRLHYNCFIGSDMVDWILGNFDDVESREEAEALGNQLMINDNHMAKPTPDSTELAHHRLGLFVHVEKRHSFRDGNYYYSIASQYAKARSGGIAWGFGSLRRDQTMPMTPTIESSSKDGPILDRLKSRSGNDDHGVDIAETSLASSVLPPPRPSGAAASVAPMMGKRPKFKLTKMIRYNVDRSGTSYRPEVINLHYDRLHNPDNCYHIRLEWLNVTAKLIEDAIVSWSKMAERYKLTLVELPINESCSIRDVHPFRSPYIIKLALPPPQAQPHTLFDTSSLGPQQTTERFFYQKAVLRKHDFVLDIEAASNFPATVDVSYSFGKLDYRYTQYVHRSGIGMAQILDNGDFLLLANKLFSSRTSSAREADRYMRSERGDVAGAGASAPRVPSATSHAFASGTPSSSPMVRALQTHSPALGPTTHLSHLSDPPKPTSPPIKAIADVVIPGMKLPGLITPETIVTELEAFCSSTTRLEAFYKEAAERAARPPTPPTQRTTLSHLSTPDAHIPALGLGESLLALTSREPSPSPMRLIGNMSFGAPVRRHSQHPSDAGSGSAAESPRPL